jgi:hypothetical protein
MTGPERNLVFASEARGYLDAVGVELTTRRGRGATVVLRLPEALHERTASECRAS